MSRRGRVKSQLGRTLFERAWDARRIGLDMKGGMSPDHVTEVNALLKRQLVDGFGNEAWCDGLLGMPM